MSVLNRTSSLSNLDQAIITSPELVGGPDNKKRKTMMEATNSKNGQTVLDFGQRIPASHSSRSPVRSSKSKEFKLLCNKIDDMKLEINNTLKQVVKVTDLDEKMKMLVTKNELHEYVEQATLTLTEENERLKGEFFSVLNENDDLKARIERLEEAAFNQEGNMDACNYKGDYCREAINDLEQHGRSNTIRMYGVPGRPNEPAVESVNIAVSVINSKLGFNFTRRDIDIAHRLPHFNKSNRSPQAIIVKFVRRMDKLSVMGKRKKLKHSKIVIQEDLTRQNSQMLNTVYKRDDVHSAWSSGGKVFAKFKDRDSTVQQIHSVLHERVKNFEKAAAFGQHLRSPITPRIHTRESDSNTNQPPTLELEQDTDQTDSTHAAALDLIAPTGNNDEAAMDQSEPPANNDGE